jgi:cytidyltransferase-like protein
MSDNIVLVTGGFDPIHSGHISYITAAREFGRVIIGLNSDDWLKRKKGSHFMPFSERHSVISNLKKVLTVIDFDDSDGTSCAAIEATKSMFPKSKIIFANGGDRTHSNIPELEKYKDDPRVEFKFGVGGEDKKNSSSWILENWKAPKTPRVWGYYRVLHDVYGCKVKELTVDPGQRLSMQKHSKRNEYWLVTEGACEINSILESGYVLPTVKLETHSAHAIPVGEWHQLYNPYETPCKIVEIQYGELCEESDIVRMEN